MSGAGGGPLVGADSPPTPTKPESKKCDSGSLKQQQPDLGGFTTTKLKIEPSEHDSPGHDMNNGLSDTDRRLVSDSDHMSPRKEGMIPSQHYDKYDKYSGLLSKEECLPPGHPVHGHHPVSMAMSLEPNLHHLTETCNNFSVDSIMTGGGSRDPSPQPGPVPPHDQVCNVNKQKELTYCFEI